MGKFPYFTEVHDEIREIAKGAAEEFKKTAVEADKKHDYKIIEKNLKRLAELNLIGIHIPTEYGGEGLDFVGHCVALEEIAKGCLSTAFSFNTQRLAMDAIRLGGTDEQKNFVGHCVALEEIAKGCLSTAFSFNTQRLAMDAIRLGGNDEQKKKYLIPACAGSIISFATTEPEAGSDVASMKTTAVKDGDSWVINGSKHYITNAMIADAHVLVAKTSAPDAQKLEFTAFVVDSDNPGIKMSKVEDKMGATA